MRYVWIGALKGSNVSDECCHLRSSKNSLLRERIPSDVSGDADIDWRRTDTYTSNAVGVYLYFINSDGSSGTRNAVMYIYASTYVLIHSPRRVASRL